ncbi:CCL13 protein, partial [Hippolais icterina]|nr:CCL13 protein [Hippolais icterina]
MKISLGLLLLLLAAAWTSIQGMSFHSRAPCCSELHKQRIPEFKIQGYKETSPNCIHKAVLVKLQKGFVCVDPKEKWFQDYLRKQKKPNSTST